MTARTNNHLAPARGRRIGRSAAAGALLGTVALLISSCGGSADAGSQPGAEGTLVRGGNLNFALSVDRGCIDPQQVGNNDAIAVARQTVASLTSQDPKTGEIVPWLAEKFEANRDATSFTFTLRSGATFADWTAIDAQSVKTNFEAIKALGAKASLGSTYLSDVSAITVKDPRTVVVDFAKPNAQFPAGHLHVHAGPALPGVGEAQRSRPLRGQIRRVRPVHREELHGGQGSGPGTPGRIRLARVHEQQQG
jgi:peptide/nickel transport system substrate-binding protein